MGAWAVVVGWGPGQRGCTYAVWVLARAHGTVGSVGGPLWKQCEGLCMELGPMDEAVSSLPAATLHLFIVSCR